ncbi:hypothetical protein WIW50_02045 [Flavobacteriaceae bacterium 3-367]|uniref:hypothetical protein n=1 Tax=Eudoraea algarum TaxID=3417568 RepID=UPI0032707264
MEPIFSYTRLFLGVMGMVALFSCGQKTFDTEKELWAHVRDTENGYTQHKKVKGVDYTLSYRPTDVLINQALGEDINKEKVDSLRNKYGDYLYFNLSLGIDNQELLSAKAGNRNEFGAMVNQLAFGMSEKVHLISKTRDTIPMADYIYPRMYGMGQSTQLLLVYPRDGRLLSNDFFHFTIDDIGFATGEVGFKIPTDPIRTEPKLKFE